MRTETRTISEKLLDNLEKVIVGKRKELEQAVIALIANGHLLIEDVPGVGKTMLGRSIARSVGCSFKRIQFTPDLLPSDITGVAVFNQKTCDFEFRPGPVMAQIVLADEINRAPPKTQSALLECMEERQVTVDGITHQLPRPFLVMGTQNSIESEGIYPLPEGELDRFLMRINLGYASFEDELAIIERQRYVHPIEGLQQVISVSELQEMQEAVTQVYVDERVKRYIVSLVVATRRHPAVYLGASPRGSVALFRTSQALAFLRGRDYVLPDDTKLMAEPALAHRIIIKGASHSPAGDARSVVSDVLNSAPVPGAVLRP